MILADALLDGGGSTGVPSIQDPYRECYAACRGAGGEITSCEEQCRGYTPGDVGCGSFVNCFVDGFEIPPSITQLPGTIGGIVADVVAPVNMTLLLAIGAGLVVLWIRKP